MSNRTGETGGRGGKSGANAEKIGAPKQQCKVEDVKLGKVGRKNRDGRS